MSHILDISHEELERTHRLVDTYKARHIWSIFFSFFPGSFKKVFQKYAEKKEELLLEYKRLHNEIYSKKIDPLSNTFIKERLEKITELIDGSSELLSLLVAHSHTQEDILHHEKLFFTKLIESFHDDVLTWVGNHEVAIFGKPQDPPHLHEEDAIKRSIKILKIKKQQLEKYIENTST